MLIFEMALDIKQYVQFAFSLCTHYSIPMAKHQSGRPSTNRISPISVNMHKHNLFLNHILLGQLNSKFIWKLLWEGSVKFNSNNPGHVIKTTTAHSYVNKLKSLG